MEKILEELATRVRARRGDMTFRQAAVQCGVPFGTLCRIENKARGAPSVHNLAKLVVWANIDANKLLHLVAVD